MVTVASRTKPFIPTALALPQRLLSRLRDRLSLAQQLVLLALLPAALATLGAITFLTRQHLAAVTTLVGTNAYTIGLQVAIATQVPLVQMDRRALINAARSGLFQPDVQQVRITTDDGEIVADAETSDFRRTDGLKATVPVTDEAGRRIGDVMVEISLDAVERARRTVWLNVLAVVVSSLLGVGLAGCWAARRISAPIRRLGAAVEDLRAGADVQVRISGVAEVRRLQRGFNATATALAEGRRLLESRISQATAELAEKNRQLEVAGQAKTRLFAAASHDLRQPLHALTLFSDGLAEGEADPVRLQRIGHIKECVEALDRLFSELLDLSQLDAGVLKPQWSEFPLDRLFEALHRDFRPQAEEKGLRLVVRKTDIWIRCDYLMLSRILSNLISNALRYTASGGVLVAARGRGRGLRIDVFDTGIGIAAHHQTRVFDEFFQVDSGRSAASPLAGGARGLGLGLSTVQRLAALIGTRIHLQSTPGRGTHMHLMLRAVQPSRSSGPLAIHSPEESRLDGLTILVVDDERAILEGLQAMLSNWGATVMAAQSHDEALALAASWDQPPDAIVSDLLLQEGKSGLEVIAALDRVVGGITAATARLIVTGETKPEHLAEVHASGITVLHKPVAPGVLRRAIIDQVRAAIHS